MKITRVEPIVVGAPTPGTGLLSDKNYIFVKVHTDEGITGLGEASLGGYLNSILGVLQDLEELVIGEDPTRIEYLTQVLTRQKFWRGGVLKGTAMNPDIWFQSAETRNKYYTVLPGILAGVYKQFGELTGRHYTPYEYYGHPEADTLLVAMGTATEIVQETIDYVNEKEGRKVGIISVRLYRPWDLKGFLNEIPETVERIAVLDRTKEPGAIGEPLYMDVVNTFEEARRLGVRDQRPAIIGGRYGLSSKDFTSSDVKALIEQSGTEVASGAKLVGDAAGKLEEMLRGVRSTSESEKPCSAITRLMFG